MRRPVYALTVLVTMLGIVLGALMTMESAASAATAKTASTQTSRPFAVGAYAGDSVTSLASLESAVGTKFAISSSFRGWGDIFPDDTQLADSATGHTLLVAWDLGDTVDTRFTTFTSGAHDDYLAAEAAAASTYGKPLYIRPWAEMNGDWVAFQPTADGSRPAGGTPAEFIAAWRYVVTFFRTHGATNVRWVFNPTTDTYDGTTPVTSIWPGSAYVDVLGLDGYNWGTGGIFTWRTFADIYTTQYRRLVALDPALPVWICEFGSKEPREDDGSPIDLLHTKYAWYQGMLDWTARTGTNVRALVMFDTDKERDWRISSDRAALKVMSGVAATAAKTVVATAPIVVTSTATAKVRATRTAVSAARAKIVVHGVAHYAWARARGRAAAVASATATWQARSVAAARTGAHVVAHRRATTRATTAATMHAKRIAHAKALAKARRVLLSRWT